MRLRCLFLALAFAALAQVNAQASVPFAADFGEHTDGPSPEAWAAPSTPCPSTPELLTSELLTSELLTPEPLTPEPSAPAPRAEVVRPAPLALPTPLPQARASAAPHHVAYREAFRILADDNECSRFFGGWPSLQALTLMTERMRSEALSNNAVGVRMSGYVTVFQNNLTGARFRIFEKVSVNSSGPLSRIPSARKLWVGRFPAGTKPAWVLILLHELGHLVRGADDKPLLPNDGGDPDQSDLNTRLVEARCDAQLNAVGF